VFRAPADPMDREAIRSLLQARRRDLTEDLEERVARMRDDGAAITPPKETDESDAGDLEVQLLEMVSTTLRRVDQAIESLDSGRYGWCTRCQRRISEARLRAVPFAVRCRECEGARERENARAREASGSHSPLRQRLSEEEASDPGHEGVSGSLFRLGR
jgi:DnaK suppressor protein